MQKLTATGTIILAVMAIAYIGFHTWLAFGLPARPLHPLPEGCTAQRAGNDGTSYDYAYFNCLADARDASVLKDYPRLASRDGETLTIFYAAKPIARLLPRSSASTDLDKDPANAPCDAYRLVKAISVRDPASARMEPLAVVTCRRDTLYIRLLIGPAGKGELVTDLAASPEGSMVGFGDNAFYRTSERPGFVLRDWKTQKSVAAFTPRCRVIAWQDSRHLTATCVYDTTWRFKPENPMPFDARAWQDNDGQWHLQATRWLNPRRASEIGVNGRYDFAPGFSLRWLPRFRAIAPGQAELP